MNFKDFYTGRRPFSSKDRIKNTIRHSKRFDASKESSENASLIQLFESPDQKTYLVATNRNLYKIIDDRREDEPVIAWSRAKEEIVKSQDKPQINFESYTPNIDKLIFETVPDYTNLVSKNLFANIDINDALEGMFKI